MAERFANAGFPVSGIRLSGRTPPPQTPPPTQTSQTPLPQTPPPQTQNPIGLVNQKVDYTKFIGDVGEPRFSLKREEHDKYISGLLTQYSEISKKETLQKETEELPQKIKTELDKTNLIKNIPNDIPMTKEVIYTIVKKMIDEKDIDGTRFTDIIKGQILEELKNSRKYNDIIEVLPVTSEIKNRISTYLSGLT